MNETIRVSGRPILGALDDQLRPAERRKKLRGGLSKKTTHLEILNKKLVREKPVETPKISQTFPRDAWRWCSSGTKFQSEQKKRDGTLRRDRNQLAG